MAKVKKTTVKENTETEILKSQLTRALADYDNLRRRTDEDKINWIKYSSQTIVIKLLNILDMFEGAQTHLKDGGLAIAIIEFKKLLNEEGLEEVIPQIGNEFNENTMEAIEIVEGKSDNMISEVVQTGWKYKEGKVVRFAKVKVTKIN